MTYLNTAIVLQIVDSLKDDYIVQPSGNHNPNCLVEVAFISNEEDEKRITEPQFQRNVAKKNSKGVTDG